MGILAVTVALVLAPFADDRLTLRPLDYHGVHVTDGLLKKQLDDAKEYYLRIPNDDLLLGFRKRAGRPAPGKELGGWYSSDTFNIFGQILSGLSRMYAATGDVACKKKAGALFEGWKECIAPDGYFYASESPNAPHYVYDKMVGGLVDLALYCGRRDALGSLGKITTWAEENLDRTNTYGFNSETVPTEWYTLSENLYRAYLATEDERYREFAKVWEYTDYWGQYAAGRSIFAKRLDGGQTSAYHAYSHVNNLGGAAMAYRVTGAKHYLDTIENAYDYLQENECFATGGFGPNEALIPKERLETLLQNTKNTFETQCGSWAVFKLCKHLISITGDARFGDWAEEVAYNGVGATIPMSPTGQVMYYSDYNPFGATKFNCPDGWSCCAGTRPMVVADVCDQIYYQSDSGIFVNLFIPSEATIDVGKTKVTITQETRFPEEPSTSCTLRVSRGTEFTLGFRRAAWMPEDVTATVNDKPVELGESQRNWLTITRAWKTGDVVKLDLPLRLQVRPLFDDRIYPAAISIGPVVLAFRSDSGSPTDKIDLEHLSEDLVANGDEPLTYHLRRDTNVLAMPFYSFQSNQEYYLYLDNTAPNRITRDHIRNSGPWHDGGTIAFCNQPGAWFEADFIGDGIRLLGSRFDDAGRAVVMVDGDQKDVLDEYGPGRDLPLEWKLIGLGPGKHTVRFTILNDKTAVSKGNFINYAGLQAIP